MNNSRTKYSKNVYRMAKHTGELPPPASLPYLMRAGLLYLYLSIFIPRVAVHVRSVRYVMLCQMQPFTTLSDHAVFSFLLKQPRTSIDVLCYESGVEVMTSNLDPDYTPRACCPGLKFEVVLNQWHAALIVKCVEMDDIDRARFETVARRRTFS